MLKKTLTYENFDGEEVTEVFYFNMSRTELIDFQNSYPGGMSGFIQKIVDTKDVKAMIEEFKKLILASYGQKSDDGRRFLKSDELTKEFTQTAAYDELFMQLATDEKMAEEFINGVLPKQIREEIEKGAVRDGNAGKAEDRAGNDV